MRVFVIPPPPPSPSSNSSSKITSISTSSTHKSTSDHYLTVPNAHQASRHKRRRQETEAIVDHLYDFPEPKQQNRRIVLFSTTSSERITHLLLNAMERPLTWGNLYDALKVDDAGMWRSISLPSHLELIQGILAGQLKLRVDVQSDEDSTSEIRGYLCTISQTTVKKAWLESKDASLDDLDEGSKFFQKCLFGIVLFD